MLTLLNARNRLRRWLDDESATPLWPDEQLDEGLLAGLAEVSQVAPWIVSEERVVNPGDTALDVPVIYQQLVRLYDPGGVPVPFDVVASEIRPAYGGSFDPGTYLLVYEKPLQLPENDTDAVPCSTRFESLLLAAAAYWCLGQRATAEAKRGGITMSEQARLEATRQDLETLRKQVRRSVHYLTLGS